MAWCSAAKNKILRALGVLFNEHLCFKAVAMGEIDLLRRAYGIGSYDFEAVTHRRQIGKRETAFRVGSDFLLG